MKLLQLTSLHSGISQATLVMARIGLALIFVLSGYAKIEYFDATAQYMEAMGLSGSLLPLVILFELLGGVLLMLGLFTQLLALAFAAFSLISGFIFHFDLADQTQFIMFYKNIAMAGGFLALATVGAGRFSLDARITNKFAQSAA